MAIMEEEFYYTHKYLQKERHGMLRGHMGNLQGWSGGREQGNTWTEPLLWFPWEGMGKTT